MKYYGFITHFRSFWCMIWLVENITDISKIPSKAGVHKKIWEQQIIWLCNRMNNSSKCWKITTPYFSSTLSMTRSEAEVQDLVEKAVHAKQERPLSVFWQPWEWQNSPWRSPTTAPFKYKFIAWLSRPQKKFMLQTHLLNQLFQLWCQHLLIQSLTSKSQDSLQHRLNKSVQTI